MGYAGVYHEYGSFGWEGYTGYYRDDLRAPLKVDQSKTWEPICVWAADSYPSSTMYVTFQASTVYVPPDDRDYMLELLSVPDGIVDAPSPGTVWYLPLVGKLTLSLPTYRTTDGLTSYHFAFTISEGPPPCGNGEIDDDEQCDDAGESATCDDDCTIAECGDGTINVAAGEECDDAGASDACDADCTLAECGDGIVNPAAGEECEPLHDSCCDASCWFSPPGTPCDDSVECTPAAVCDGSGACIGYLLDDCNENGIEDLCEIEDGLSRDCQPNGVPDECDIANRTSRDRFAGTLDGQAFGDGIPDECQIAECRFEDERQKSVGSDSEHLDRRRRGARETRDSSD
ncbi:MAG: hypothetical protein JSU63_06640 [Phycisphaerales bacterium]|nr:MAG: hypothetical protein JSU63_06640 [Phycisphaerales bacterium]